MSTEEKFNKALEEVKITSPDNATKLRLYGLYKQIHEGDNKLGKPWAYQVEKNLKWQAWKDNQGKDKETCQLLYIDIVDRLFGRSC